MGIVPTFESLRFAFTKAREFVVDRFPNRVEYESVVEDSSTGKNHWQEISGRC